MTTTERLRRGALSNWEKTSLKIHQRRQDRSGTVEFVHINKTGGSSVETALGLPFHHYTAQMRIDRLGVQEWNRRYSFTFVRNPWDRLVSQYHHRKGRGRLRRDLGFADWLRATLIEGDLDLINQPQSFYPQLTWITGRSGEVVVDDVYRFESIAEDFASVCRRIGVVSNLPHNKPSRHRHYSAYYDAKAADVVGDLYEQDIEKFGYRFDKSANR